MSPVADISVPAGEFLLPDAVAGVTDLRIVAEPSVALPDASVTPYVCVDGDDFRSFEESLASDATAADFDALPFGRSERRYRIEWTDPSCPVLSILDRVRGSIARAEFVDGRWRLRVRFPNRESLSAFCERCRRRCPVTLDRVCAAPESNSFREGALSADQREALLAALRRGYFEVPRAATQEDLAAELGITSQSVSQRLRRGQRNLLRNTLATEDSRTAPAVRRDG